MKRKAYRFFVADFETTVYAGQEKTEVWSAASVELFDENEKVVINHSIDEQFKYFLSLDSNLIVYFHNLKFDGSFILSYLLLELNFVQAIKVDENGKEHWQKNAEMENGSFRYSITDMGQWYTIVVKANDIFIEFRDSLKLLPFSVKELGNSFGTKHKKLEMEYKGYRYAGCNITDEERKYIANDVLVVKEALEIAFMQGHKKLTIGSCCLDEYKKIIGWFVYNENFPDLYSIPLDKEEYGSDNAGEYIRKSYRGGWCYLVKGKENKLFHDGVTADVNSLYPSVMSSESGSFYPVGKPTFWKGNYIPNAARNSARYYFLRIKTRFYIRDGFLPFIQIKNNLFYKSTEMLETSDVFDSNDGKFYPYYYNTNGEIEDAFVIMTVTCTDFQLIQEHYDLVSFEILDGCYFYAKKGIFDKYIDKYRKIKMESKGAVRTLAKLFLNNLYGKMASSPDSSFKVAYVKDNGVLGFRAVEEHEKQAGYIAVGSAITSYARNFTIRAAQKNYYGTDKAGFIYADTDSIHCDLLPSQLKGIAVDDTKFCHWKLESNWDIGLFVRQKTYIEHEIAENLKPIERPIWNVKCAGMPQRSKELFIANVTRQEIELKNDDERDFMAKKLELTDFKIGLKVPGKLLPKRIAGGVLLCDTTFEMREN